MDRHSQLLWIKINNYWLTFYISKSCCITNVCVKHSYKILILTYQLLALDDFFQRTRHTVYFFVPWVVHFASVTYVGQSLLASGASWAFWKKTECYKLNDGCSRPTVSVCLAMWDQECFGIAWKYTTHHKQPNGQFIKINVHYLFTCLLSSAMIYHLQLTTKQTCNPITKLSFRLFNKECIAIESDAKQISG